MATEKKPPTEKKPAVRKEYRPRLNNWSTCINFIKQKIYEMDELAKSPKGTGADRGRVMDALKVLHQFMMTKDLTRIEEKFDELKKLRRQSNLPWGKEDDEEVEEFLKANRG
jgi:hypothetical protein